MVLLDVLAERGYNPVKNLACGDSTRYLPDDLERDGRNRHRRFCQMLRFSFLRIRAITWLCARLASIPLARL
jgi:hypothetical protein